jgi:hypothetical protein
MKKLSILSISLVAATIFIVACNPTQANEQYLKDDNQRKALITTIAHNQSYMTEMMGEMMTNDSCKKMMGEMMMKDDAMKNMMMTNMMDMCEKDSNMLKKMMTMMHDKPMMMNKMKEMNMPANSVMYTCPMHPEVIAAMPGNALNAV